MTLGITLSFTGGYTSGCINVLPVHVYDEDNFFVLFCIDSGIHIKGAQGTALTAVSFPASFHNNYQGEPLTSTNVYKEFQPFKCSANLSIRQVAFLLACD